MTENAVSIKNPYAAKMPSNSISLSGIGVVIQRLWDLKQASVKPADTDKVA
jgi:hypothetical protein